MTAAVIDTRADTWVATDGLGRSLPGLAEVGPSRPGKFVGIFYFLWLGQHGTAGPYDIPKILAADPKAMLKPDSPLWGGVGVPHHWGESLFGYYLSDDSWVLRKHAQMLSDAGVDVVIFDVSNQVTYPRSYLQLCKTFSAVREDGGKSPQIAFLCPFWNPTNTAQKLYDELYKPKLYPDLWFQWKGKPLLLADPAKVSAEVREFFTLRQPQPDYFIGPTGPNQWAWLEIHPQHVFTNVAGQAEQMAVGVAQNGHNGRLCAFSETNTYGRSWHDGKKDKSPDAVRRGLNVAEQWERALKVDPQFIFITGWNEWIAGRFGEFAGVREPVMFVDEFTQEYSRDIEPMKGGHGDDYYWQMVANIRKFKGVRPPDSANGRHTIKIDGRFDDWSDVEPKFHDDAGDTTHRDHPGYDNAGYYVNTTGRNDFVLAQAAYDSKCIYFHAQTSEPITAPEQSNWMTLFIDVDCDHKTGWEGYDLVVNRVLGPTPDKAVVEESQGGWQWAPCGTVTFKVNGKDIELAIPRKLLRLTKAPQLRFDFKWADNFQADGEILDFFVNGDAAPNGRFNYRFNGSGKAAASRE